MSPTEIKAAWTHLLAEHPHARIRNAADQLGLREAQLLATQCGETVTRLRADWRGILSRIHELGYVMALTRNPHVVHERKGIYNNASLDSAHVGLFVNEDIDLRIFWKPWTYAYAVTAISRGKERKSIQFFDAAGDAIHKIYLTPKSDWAAYTALVDNFRHEDQSWEQPVGDRPEPKAELEDAEIDVTGFQQEWIDLKDTHDFFGMTQKYKVSRPQALRLAPEGNYAVPIDPKAFRRCIEKVAEREIPIMVFVGNHGMIQIHTGPVKKLLDHQTWFNIMDPIFHFHLDEAAIDKVWAVRKPTEDGTVTSLEVFSADGEMMVQVFGKRKPGIPELEGWREVVAELEKEAANAIAL